MSKLASYKINISFEHCKACGLCLEYCPAGALAFSSSYNSRGLHPAELADASLCKGCGFCAIVCPDAAIEISEEQ